jgi:uncharacterized protein (TIGR02246 family)
MLRKKFVCTLPIVASMLLVTQSSCHAELDASSGKEFVARWQQAYNKHDPKGFAALYAPSGRYRVPMALFPATSRDQFRQTLEKMWRNRPNAKITSTNRVTVGANNTIAFIWTLSFSDLKTKGPATIVGASFMTLEGGLVKDETTVFKRIAAGIPAKPKAAGAAKPAAGGPKPRPPAPPSPKATP